MDLLHKHNEQVQYGLSYDLWRTFPVNEILTFRDRNVGIGFFDDFLSFQATSLEGPYRILEGTGCTVEQINCTGDSSTKALGMIEMALDGNASNDEVALQFGRGLAAPFKFDNNDLIFECRLAVSAITAAKWSWGVGLGETGMGATDGLFVDTTGALADKNFVGFNHLKAEGAAVDACWKADGETYQDGATKTKLDSLKTMVADTFVKLGFRYEHHPRRLRWFIDGVEDTSAALTKAELDNDNFPDDKFMTPIIGAKDIAGDAALDIYVDWWACAQRL